MKSITRTTAATTAAIALLATPAFGQDAPQGQTTSPAKICKAQNLSKKKTNHGKGKSPFASCVSGAKKQIAEAKRESNPSEQRSPAKMCADHSRKKDSNDQKSPFAACVVGVTETRKAQREAEQS